MTDRKIIFLMGPIASGKGTQADILAKKLGLFHFETSRFLEAQLSRPEFAKQKKQFDSGSWVDPSWVAQIVCAEASQILQRGQGLVFSGSPRTIEETTEIIPCLEGASKKKDMMFFNITLSEAESVARSISRRICKANRHPIPNFPEFQNITLCPEDGSELIRRSLDKPEIVAKRYQEYLNRTVPIFDFLKQRGYDVIQINGEQSIGDVSEDIMEHLPPESAPAYQNTIT